MMPRNNMPKLCIKMVEDKDKFTKINDILSRHRCSFRRWVHAPVAYISVNFLNHPV